MCKVKTIERKYRDVAPSLANALSEHYYNTLQTVKESGLVEIKDGKITIKNSNNPVYYKLKNEQKTSFSKEDLINDINSFKGKSGKLFEYIINNTTNETYKKLAFLFAKNLDKINDKTSFEGFVSFSNETYFEKVIDSSGVCVFHKNGTSSIFLNSEDNIYDIDDLFHVILHEFTHAFTVSSLTNNNTLEEKQFNKDITLLYDYFNKYNKSEDYGFTNKREFVSEILTNPNFVKTLKNIEINNTSVFDKFINAIKKLFGKINENYITDDVINYILSSIDNNEVNLRDYSQRNELISYVKQKGYSISVKDNVVQINPLNATTIDLPVFNYNQALEYANTIIPIDSKDLQFLSQTAFQAKFNDALGAYKQGLISIAENNGKIGKSVLRHEIFHKVWNEYLTPAEKDSLFMLYKKEFDTKSVFEFEEKLAEKFQDYVSTKKAPSLVRKIFNKILRFFNLIKANSKSINDFFDQIDNGVFSVKKDTADSEVRYMINAKKKMGSLARYEFALDFMREMANQVFSEGAFTQLGKNNYKLLQNDPTAFITYVKALCGLYKNNPALIKDNPFLSGLSNTKYKDENYIISQKEDDKYIFSLGPNTPSLFESIISHTEELFADAFNIDINKVKDSANDVEESADNLSQEIKDKTNVDYFENASQKVKIFLSTIKVGNTFMNYKFAAMLFYSAGQFMDRKKTISEGLADVSAKMREGSVSQKNAMLNKLKVLEDNIVKRNNTKLPIFMFDSNHLVYIGNVKDKDGKSIKLDSFYSLELPKYDDINVGEVEAYYKNEKVTVTIIQKHAKSSLDTQKKFVIEIFNSIKNLTDTGQLNYVSKTLVTDIITQVNGTVSSDIYTSLQEQLFSITERNISYIKEYSRFEQQEYDEDIDSYIQQMEDESTESSRTPIETIAKIKVGTKMADVPIKTEKVINQFLTTVLEKNNPSNIKELNTDLKNLLNKLESMPSAKTDKLTNWQSELTPLLVKLKFTKSDAEAYAKNVIYQSFEHKDFIVAIKQIEENIKNKKEILNDADLRFKLSTPITLISKNNKSNSIPSTSTKTYGGKKQHRFVTSNTIFKNLTGIMSYGNEFSTSETILPDFANFEKSYESINPFVVDIHAQKEKDRTKPKYKIEDFTLMGGKESTSLSGYQDDRAWANLTTKQRHVMVLQYAFGHGEFKDASHWIPLPQQGDAQTAYAVKVEFVKNPYNDLKTLLKQQGMKLTISEQVEKLGYSAKNFNEKEIVDFSILDKAVKEVAKKEGIEYNNVIELCRTLSENESYTKKVYDEINKLFQIEIEKEALFIAKNKYNFKDDFYGSTQFGREIKSMKSSKASEIEAIKNKLLQDPKFKERLTKIVVSHAYQTYFLNQYLNGASEFYKNSEGTLKRRDSNGSPKRYMRINNESGINTNTGAARPKFKVLVVNDVDIFGTYSDIEQKADKMKFESEEEKTQWIEFQKQLSSEKMLNDLGLTKEEHPDLHAEWAGSYKPTDGQGFHTERRNTEITKNYGVESDYGDILKPLINDRYEVNGYHIPFIGKYSSAKVTKDSNSYIGRKLAEFMDKYGIDEIMFDSAIKTGQPDIKYQITLDEIFSDNEDVINNKLKTSSIEINNENYGLQLNPISTKQKVTFFSQLFYFPNITQFDNEGKINPNGHSTEAMYSYMGDLIKFRNSEFNRKMKNSNGRFKKFSLNMEIQKQIQAKNLAGMDLVYDLFNSFKDANMTEAAYNMPIFSEMLENAILNGTYKNVIQTKFKGKKNVLVSSVLTNNYIFNSDIQNKVENLKTYKKGTRIVSQAIIPKGYKDEKGEWKGLLPEDVQNKMLKNVEQGKDINDGIDSDFLLFGFRIPSTGIHSALPLEISGFYDDNGTNGIIVPPDVVQKHGSDFDVDSLFTIAYDTFKEDLSITVDNKPIVFKKGERIGFKDDKFNPDFAKNMKTAMEIILNNPETEKDNFQYITKLATVVEQAYTNGIAYEMNEVFANEQNAHMMTTTINMDVYKDVIKKLYGKSQRITDFTTISGALKQTEVAMAGVVGTGIAASALKFLGYIYKSGPNGNAPKLNSNVLNSITYLENGAINQTVTGVTINRDTIKELDGLVNLNIDNIKELGLDALNLSENTITLFIAMRIMGLNLEQASTLMTTKLVRYIRDTGVAVNDKFLQKFGIDINEQPKDIILSIDDIANSTSLLNKDFNWNGEDFDFASFNKKDQDTMKDLLVYLYHMNKIANMSAELNKFIDTVAKPKSLVKSVEEIEDIYNKLLSVDVIEPTEKEDVELNQPSLFNKLVKISENNSTVSNRYILEIPNFLENNPHIKAAVETVLEQKKALVENFPMYSDSIRNFLDKNFILKQVKLSEIKKDDIELKRGEVINYIMSAFSQSKYIPSVNVGNKLVDGHDAFRHFLPLRFKAIKKYFTDNDIKNPFFEILSIRNNYLTYEGKVADLYNQNVIKESSDELAYLKEQYTFIDRNQLDSEGKPIKVVLDNLMDVTPNLEFVSIDVVKSDTKVNNSSLDFLFEINLLTNGLSNASKSPTKYFNDAVIIKHSKNFKSVLSMLSNTNVSLDYLLDSFKLEFMIKHASEFKTLFMNDPIKQSGSLTLKTNNPETPTKTIDKKYLAGYTTGIGFYDRAYDVGKKSANKKTKSFIKVGSRFMKLVKVYNDVAYYRTIAVLKSDDYKKSYYSMNDKLLSYSRLNDIVMSYLDSANIEYDVNNFHISEYASQYTTYLKDRMRSGTFEDNDYYKAVLKVTELVTGTKIKSPNALFSTLESLTFNDKDGLTVGKHLPIIPVTTFNQNNISIDLRKNEDLYRHLQLHTNNFTINESDRLYLVAHLISDIGIQNPILKQYSYTIDENNNVILELQDANLNMQDYLDADYLSTLYDGEKEATFLETCKL